MLQLFPRLSRILLASTFAVSAVASAVPPSQPASVPIPYPSTSPGDDASATRMHKPFLIRKELDKSSPLIFATQPDSCASTNVQPLNGAAAHVGTADDANSMVSLKSVRMTHKIDNSSPVLMDSTASGSACH